MNDGRYVHVRGCLHGRRSRFGNHKGRRIVVGVVAVIVSVGRIVLFVQRVVLVDLLLFLHLVMVEVVVRIISSSSSHSNNVDVGRRQFGRDQVGIGGVEVHIRILLLLLGVVVVGMQWIFLS